MKNKKFITVIITGVVFLAAAGALYINSKLNSPYFFIQMTDPQFGFIDPATGFEKETLLYEKAVSEINRLKPSFVVITGDLVHTTGDPSQIAEFKRITGEINDEIPVYIIPGNHDIQTSLEQKDIDEYSSVFGDPTFSFNYKRTSFIGINSSVIKANSPILEEEQYELLKTELSSAKKPEHIIVFSHHPFFITEPDEADSYSNVETETRQKYIDLFNEYNVDAVFAGHTHKNSSARSGEMQMIITSAVGRPLGSDASGFRIVKVFKDKISSNYYPLNDMAKTVSFRTK